MKNVQQVFVATDGNAAPGTAVNAVAAGDFVVIDGGLNTTEANISSVTADFFHFAVGTSGNTVVSDSFPKTATRTSSVAAYQAAVDKVVQITLGKVSCETEYMLKVRFEGEAVAKTYGYNDLIKTFSYTTACCDPCSTDCPSGSCLDLAWGLLTNVNADEEGLVLARLNSAAFAAAAGIPSGGSEIITQADYDAYLEYVTVTAPQTEPDICNDLFFALEGQTSDPKALVCGQDPMQLSQTVLDFHVGLLGGFSCNGSSVTVIQDPVFAIGEPYQVANLARWAEGYKRAFGVYRTPFPYDTFVANGVIDPVGTYDIVTITLQTLEPSAATLNPSITGHEIIVAVDAGNAANVVALLA
jgi:hypothetical protein